MKSPHSPILPVLRFPLSTFRFAILAAISLVTPAFAVVNKANNRDSTVEFSDGTVFAYEMSIPAWQRDTAGKVYIVDYVEDRPGAFNPKPIGGSYLNLSDAPQVPEDQILLAR